MTSNSQVATGEFDVIQIVGQLAFWSGNHDSAGVDVLAFTLVVAIPKSDRVGEPPALVFAAGEEMPASFTAETAVARHVGIFLCSCQAARLAGIEADDHHLEIGAGAVGNLQ